MYVAKYYILSACYLAFHSKDDDVKDQISQSFFQDAEQLYKSGEWLTFVSMMELTLLSHHHYDKEPLDIVEHDKLQRVFVYGSLVRTLSQRFWPEICEHVEEKFSSWPLDQDTREELNKLIEEPDADSYWKKAPLEDIWHQVERDLSGKPFSDVGEERSIVWKAMGIEWEICFANEYELTRVSEEFVAVLQIALAELALRDLQILPVKVKINIDASRDDKIAIEDKFTNKMLEWEVKLPIFSNDRATETDADPNNVLAYAVSVLSYCTTMNHEDFQNQIEQAFRNGLFGKAFFVRPYPMMYGDIITLDMFMEAVRCRLASVEADRVYNVQEHPALNWCREDGALFDREEAKLHAENRYKRLSK